jgi:hypothetical protein
MLAGFKTWTWVKWRKQQTAINLISPVGNTNQRMGEHRPLDILV